MAYALLAASLTPFHVHGQSRTVVTQDAADGRQQLSADGQPTPAAGRPDYVVFNHSTLRNLSPAHVPADNAIARSVACVLARDEFESVQIGVRAVAGDLRDVRIEVETDLQVTVYHRIAPAIRDQLVSMYATGNGIARWIPSQVHLQRGKAFDEIPQGESVNFWLTFRADPQTRSGLHVGKIRIRPAGKPHTELKLEINVRDFQLQRPRAAFGMFFREDMLPKHIGGLAAPRASVLAMFRDLADHGHNSGWFYPGGSFSDLPPTDSSALHKLIPLAKQAGLVDRNVPSMICGGLPGGLDLSRLQAAIRWLDSECQRRGWPELIVFGTDEPEYPRDADLVRKQLRRLRGLPIRVNVDLSATAAYGYGDLCDVLNVMDGGISPEMQAEAERRGTQIWTYSYRIWREDFDPLRQRFYAGLYTWTHRLGGNWIWAYHHTHHRHAWFAPDSHQPQPVTGYEARREGIDDYRYLQMLEDCIAAAENQTLASEAAAWLRSLRGRLADTVPNTVMAGRPLTIDAFDEIRTRASGYIRKLGPVAGVVASPAGQAKDEAADYRGRSAAACIEGLSHADASRRRAAAWALSELGPRASEATESLARALDDPVVRIPALHALEAIGPGAHRSVPAIAALLQHRDFYVRIGAVLALSEIGCPLAVRDRSGRRSPANRAALVVDPLVTALADERPSVARQAAETLSVMGQLAQPALPAAIRMLDDSNPTRQTAAIGLITDLGPSAEAAVPRLIQLHSTWNSRHIAALAAIGPAAAQAVARLEQDANMHTGTRRADTLQALAFIRNEISDLRDLIKLLKDPTADAATKQHILKRLTQLGTKAQAIASEIQTMLDAGELAGAEQACREFLDAVRNKTRPGISFDW